MYIHGVGDKEIPRLGIELADKGSQDRNISTIARMLFLVLVQFSIVAVKCGLVNNGFLAILTMSMQLERYLIALPEQAIVKAIRANMRDGIT